MNNNTEINNSLQRLADAGKEYTATSKELYDAAYDVAQEIIEAAPVRVALPRNYKVIYVSSNIGGEYFLENDGQIVDAKKGYYLHNDFNSWIDKAPKSLILKFARDIQQGLLTEIAEFLENKAAEQKQIAERLSNRS